MAANSTSWTQTLAAANQEGAVVIAGPPGPRYREGVRAFERAYPRIRVEFSGGSGRDLIPKILEERRNSLYLWDVYVGGSSNGYDLMPAGALQPLRNALVRPEVVEDSKWFGGFADGYHDLKKEYVFGFQGYLSFHVQVNRDVVSEEELSSFDQLLDPKWKGRISWQDPRVTGAGATTAGQLLLIQGEEYYRKLLGQDITPYRDARQQGEHLVRGSYPIALGSSSDVLTGLQAEGLGMNVHPLAPRTSAGARISSGFGTVMLVDRAPHPRAAAVFINWLLDQEGQQQWVTASGTNSRRLDVTGPAETALYPGVERRTVNDEAFFASEAKARQIAAEILR